MEAHCDCVLCPNGVKCSRNQSNWTLPALFPVKKCCCWESSFHSRGWRADLRNGGWFRAVWVKSFWQKETEGPNIWLDFFCPLFWVSLDNPLHSNCLACHILAKAIRMNVGGKEGGGVCCLGTIEVILSYVHVSLLLNAVFRNENFYGPETWNEAGN